MPSRRVPVTLIVGSLGAGKTTLLRRLVGDCDGRRLLVVENDLAEASVDEWILGGAGAGVVGLPGGCLCCGVRGDLSETLRSIRGVDPPPDAVLIEASGVSSPGPPASDVVELGASGEPLWLRSIVAVVDAANVDTAREEIGDQVAHADLVVLTKLDLVPAEDARRLATRIAALSPVARVLPSTEVGLEDVVGPAGDRTESAYGGSGEAPVILDHAASAVTLPVPGDLDPAAARALLADLAEDPAVLRVKGFLSVGGVDHLAQGVAGRMDLAPATVPRGADRCLVVIGVALDAPVLRERLLSARAG